MKILFSEFHHRTNLTAPLLSNLGSKNKTTDSEFRILLNLKGPLQIPNYEMLF
jgi:hypothetical protein